MPWMRMRARLPHLGNGFRKPSTEDIPLCFSRRDHWANGVRFVRKVERGFLALSISIVRCSQLVVLLPARLDFS